MACRNGPGIRKRAPPHTHTERETHTHTHTHTPAPLAAPGPIQTCVRAHPMQPPGVGEGKPSRKGATPQVGTGAGRRKRRGNGANLITVTPRSERVFRALVGLHQPGCVHIEKERAQLGGVLKHRVGTVHVRLRGAFCCWGPPPPPPPPFRLCVCAFVRLCVCAFVRAAGACR